VNTTPDVFFKKKDPLVFDLVWCCCLSFCLQIINLTMLHRLLDVTIYPLNKLGRFKKQYFFKTKKENGLIFSSEKDMSTRMFLRLLIVRGIDRKQGCYSQNFLLPSSQLFLSFLGTIFKIGTHYF
jgi:hypothetical protein